MTDLKVAVVGGGIGGLMSALALARKGIAVTVFERDAPPPADVTPDDSMAWLHLVRAWLASGRYARQGLLPRGRPGRGELANIPPRDPSRPRPLPGEVLSASG